jgi:hypothetical protein
MPAPTKGMRRTNSRCVDGESKFIKVSKAKEETLNLC